IDHATLPLWPHRFLMFDPNADTMTFRLLAVCVLTVAGAVVEPALAQTAAEKITIEAAVARHFKPWLTQDVPKSVMLDSRFGLSRAVAERPSLRTQELAQILGLPVGHTEDVISCKVKCADAAIRANFAMAIGTVSISGNTATVWIMTKGQSGASRVWVTY